MFPGNDLQTLFLNYVVRGKCPHPSRQKAADHWIAEIKKTGKIDEGDIERLEKLRAGVPSLTTLPNDFRDAVVALMGKMGLDVGVV